MDALWFVGVFDLPWWGAVAVALGLTHVTIAAVTIYLHRHQAHHAIALHPVASHFFRFWLWLTTGMVTKEWASAARIEHTQIGVMRISHNRKSRNRGARGVGRSMS